jgi:histidinol-phosphate phosphatase family protein
MTYDVVIPSAGRASLARLLESLAAGTGPLPERVIVVDDTGGGPLPALSAGLPVEVVSGGGRGPAAARNAGWRVAGAEWVAFLDDDVMVPSGWRSALVRDLDGLPPRVAASQGRIVVPLERDRRPTDWERNVRGLEDARWATADMAYRRSALAAVGGFDERFRRAYREDADLGLRLRGAGFEIRRGGRHVLHPVPSAGATVSLRLQAGNADDPLMRRLHGRGWRAGAGAPRGRLPLHALTTAAGLGALVSLAAGRRRAACGAGAAWLAATAELAWARIASGPRTPAEIAMMLVTSALLPPLATFHRARGELRARRLPRRAGVARGPRDGRPAAVLLDRDGTLVEDVPYNGDPAAVRPMPGAREALDRLRAAGVRLAVVSNQSGIARGLISERDMRAVNARIDELLGPLERWLVCPHGPDERCACRKPAPGLILRAAEALRVAPADCVVVGDIGADMEAARAAGARAILVPTPRTRREERDAAPAVAGSLAQAAEMILGRASASAEAAA